jgi:hypothetical protein
MTKIYEFINKPAGDYGLGGTPFEEADFLLIKDEGNQGTGSSTGPGLSGPTELIITSSTTGTITAQWIDFQSQSESVTNFALTFNGTGLPAVGNLRFDIVQGNNAGAVSVKQGIEALAIGAVIPSADANNLVLSVVLWAEDGVVEVTPPVVITPLQNDFSVIRMTTAVTPNSTGQFAKIFETDLSISNNYSFILHYAEPKNGVNFDGSGAQELRLSFTADTSRVIIPETVQIVTSPGSSAGEFVLYQLAGNRFAVYHRSNHYWGRIQFRIVFQNSQVPLTDFFNNSPYEVEIGFLARYGSVVEGGGIIELIETQSTVIKFDSFGGYIHGNTFVITGAMTYDFTGAIRGVVVIVKHRASSFTVPAKSVVIAGYYSPNVDNYIFFELIKKDSGTEVILVTISQNV